MRRIEIDNFKIIFLFTIIFRSSNDSILIGFSVKSTGAGEKYSRIV